MKQDLYFPKALQLSELNWDAFVSKSSFCRWRWGYFLNIDTQMSKVYDFHMPATIIVSPWRLGIKTTICAGFVGLRVTLLHATIQLWTSDNGFFFFFFWVNLMRDCTKYCLVFMSMVFRKWITKASNGYTKANEKNQHPQ